MVGPQNANPSAFRALDSFREMSVSVAMPARSSAVPWIGAPSTKSQRKAEKPCPRPSMAR